MKHLIYHPNKGWLCYDRQSNTLSWSDKRWYADELEIQELGTVLLALGYDQSVVAIIPWNKKTPAWYDRTDPISFDLGDNQYDWLKNHLCPFWNGIGNCSWFVDFDGRSYGPISSHEFGGFTLPYSKNNDRYESVFMAAAMMMSDRVELFKGITRCASN